MLNTVPRRSLFKKEKSGGRKAECKGRTEREDMVGAANLSLPLVLKEATENRPSQGLGCSASPRPQADSIRAPGFLT